MSPRMRTSFPATNSCDGYSKHSNERCGPAFHFGAEPENEHSYSSVSGGTNDADVRRLIRDAKMLSRRIQLESLRLRHKIHKIKHKNASWDSMSSSSSRSSGTLSSSGSDSSHLPPIWISSHQFPTTYPKSPSPEKNHNSAAHVDEQILRIFKQLEAFDVPETMTVQHEHQESQNEAVFREQLTSHQKHYRHCPNHPLHKQLPRTWQVQPPNTWHVRSQPRWLGKRPPKFWNEQPKHSRQKNTNRQYLVPHALTDKRSATTKSDYNHKKYARHPSMASF